MRRRFVCSLSIAGLVFTHAAACAATRGSTEIRDLERKYGFISRVMDEELAGLVRIISQEEEIGERRNLSKYCFGVSGDEDEEGRETRALNARLFMDHVLEKRDGEIRKFVASMPAKRGRLFHLTQGVVGVTVEWTLTEADNVGQIASLGWRLCDGFDQTMSVSVRSYDTRDGVELTGEQYLHAHYADISKLIPPALASDKWLRYIKNKGALFRFSGRD